MINKKKYSSSFSMHFLSELFRIAFVFTIQLTLSLAFLDCGLLSFCSVEEKSELEALMEEHESEILKGEASREVLSEESSICGQRGRPALPKRNVHDC